MSKKPNEWERFAFTSLEVNPQPWHMPLPDLKAAILKELSTTGQIEPWSLYYFLVREAALIPQEIRNYLAEIAVGRKNTKSHLAEKRLTQKQNSKFQNMCVIFLILKSLVIYSRAKQKQMRKPKLSRM